MSAERTRWRTTAGLGGEGPNGSVLPARVLEWMQDAAAHASALGGYPPDRYRAMGAGWFIKEILLAIDLPIRYGDAIAVETWVSDFRRFRSRREYRIFANDRLVARGQADWMLLERDRESGRVRPLRPDEEMLAAFPRVAEHALAEGEVPAWTEHPEPTPFARDTRVVRPSELDRHDHVNHVMYLGWTEDHARTIFGDGSELRRARLEYLSDARARDPITISGWRQGDLVHQSIERDGSPLCRVSTIRTF